jgi:ubiquinone/menaquinone biosynthesis C-methylase UbiE
LTFPFDEATLRERLVEQATLEPGQRLLDLGCGTGSLLIAIRKQWPSVRAVGLDDDAGLLVMARRKAASAGVNVHLVAGSRDAT